MPFPSTYGNSGNPTIPQVGNMGEYVVNYKEDMMKMVADIIQEWNDRVRWGPETLAEDRFRPSCNEDYVDWLRTHLQGTLTLGPNRYHFSHDKDSKDEIKTRRVQR
ncbi:hypothetical protein K7X08_015085 [Anisodus acutangulus]|uniref:Uncharacterized protein n=1 Tax=Anisodus acutangulus TaxID=402998 RepID=A0A9Q1L3T9_9SOLA|nr:hypothetical protein K7X08_015085 [Anisodus acutangulus]